MAPSFSFRRLDRNDEETIKQNDLYVHMTLRAN